MFDILEGLLSREPVRKTETNRSVATETPRQSWYPGATMWLRELVPEAMWYDPEAWKEELFSGC